jgi:hypothetical protein
VNIADGARLEALPGLAVPAAASLKFAIHRRDGRPGELVQRHLAEVGFDVQPPKFPVARVGAGCQSEAGEVFVAPPADRLVGWQHVAALANLDVDVTQSLRGGLSGWETAPQHDLCGAVLEGGRVLD